MQKNINLDAYDQLKKKASEKKFAIFSMFLDRNSANAAIKSLKSHGFLQEDISLLTPKKKGGHDFVYHQNNNIKLSAFIGGIAGFLILGLAGVFIGSADLFDLGLSSLLSSVIVGAIVGLIMGAAIGVLVGIGTPKPAAKRYNFYLKEGGIVVKMHLKNEEDSEEAHFVLEKAGGQDITILEESQIWSIIVPERNKFTFH